MLDELSNMVLGVHGWYCVVYAYWSVLDLSGFSSYELISR